MACAKCDTVSVEHKWLPATNEDGWRCGWCSGGLGFRPDLDRELLDEKVGALLFWLHEAKIVYVSNGTQGEVVTENVATLARGLGQFDQYSLVGLILKDPNLAGHADYWAGEARRWLGERGLGPAAPSAPGREMRASGAAPLPGFADLIDASPGSPS